MPEGRKSGRGLWCRGRRSTQDALPEKCCPRSALTPRRAGPSNHRPLASLQPSEAAPPGRHPPKGARNRSVLSRPTVSFSQAS